MYPYSIHSSSKPSLNYQQDQTQNELVQTQQRDVGDNAEVLAEKCSAFKSTLLKQMYEHLHRHL